MGVDFARAAILRANIIFGTTGNIENAIQDCSQCLGREDDIDQFSEAIILSGLSYLLRRYEYRYTQASAEHGWLADLYIQRYHPDTAKHEFDSEAFHLAQRACLMMAQRVPDPFGQMDAWMTDTDPLGVKAFTAWLKRNAKDIVEQLDDISVIDFTNTIGSAVEYVHKTMGPKEAAQLRKSGVYDMRTT